MPRDFLPARSLLVLVMAMGVLASLANPVSAQSRIILQRPGEAVDVMVAAVDAQNAASIASLYAPDAIVMGPNQPVIAGRDAIQNVWAENFANGYAQLEVVSPRTEVGTDRAAMIFNWQATIQPQGGEPVQIRGRSLLYFTLVDGGWLISADSWHPIP